MFRQRERLRLFEGATQTNTKWVNGEVVCVMTNSSQINNFTSANENVEYMVVNMPVQTDASKQLNDGYGLEPPQLMCSDKNSEHVEEAVDFLDYFFNNEDAAVILKRSSFCTAYRKCTENL